jgi:hypothetical protein
MKKPDLPAEGVDLRRRRISIAAAMALLGGATVTLTSCSSGSSPTTPSAPPSAPPSPAASSCPADAVCGQISIDPRHSAVITGAQLAAGGALVLDITGTQVHGHQVQLTADEVVAIRGRQRVVKTSSFNLNHEHVVTFN